MRRARRTRYLFFYAEDRSFVDVELLLRGRAQLASVRQLYAISILTGKEHPITRSDLTALLAIPSNEWVDIDDNGTMRRFASDGLVVTDDDSEELAELRRRDEQLHASAWNLYGALYHSMTRWRDIDIDLEERTQASDELIAEVAEEVVAERGLPPHHFHAVRDPLAVYELPLVRSEEGLYAALTRRRTTRLFSVDSRLRGRDLAILLYYVFGCHSYLSAREGVAAIRRTSPSGGGLHPIEAYPLLLSVEGYEAGIYHYNVERHALELLRALEQAEAAALVEELTCGQFYFRGASAVFLLTARFSRTFWKYRHERAYAVVLLDAAHLSQTFYLVCSDLGLGSFLTAAVNAANIDAVLGLDGFSEGALAVLGCGVPSAEPSFLQPAFEPYVPRETAVP